MANTEPTISFSIKEDREKELKRTLTTVYEALLEKGYNPINSWLAISSAKTPPISPPTITPAPSSATSIAMSCCRCCCAAIWSVKCPFSPPY